MNRGRRLALRTLVVACWIGSTAPAATVDFEGIPPGTLYGGGVPNTPGAVVLTQQNIDMSVELFFLGDFQGFYRAEIGGRYQHFFDSTPLDLNNITVSFDFANVGFDVNRVTLEYIEFGGASNFAVNGVIPHQLASLVDIPGEPVPGIDVTVNAATSAGPGTIIVTGDIDRISIGGQELAIDNIVAIPEPATVILLSLGASFALGRRRRPLRTGPLLGQNG